MRLRSWGKILQFGERILRGAWIRGDKFGVRLEFGWNICRINPNVGAMVAPGNLMDAPQEKQVLLADITRQNCGASRGSLPVCAVLEARLVERQERGEEGRQTGARRCWCERRGRLAVS